MMVCLLLGLPSLQPVLQAGLAHGERIAQCVHIKLRTKKCIPVQIDGGMLCFARASLLHAVNVSRPFCVHLQAIFHTCTYMYTNCMLIAMLTKKMYHANAPGTVLVYTLEVKILTWLD